MSHLPFVLLNSEPSPETKEGPGRDVPTSEDPLPAVVETDGDGFILARETRITEVKRETTDD